MSRLDDIRKLQDRTKSFAVSIIRFFSDLPRTEVARTIGRQLLRSGTSVAANYRAVCRARSSADFISKISVVLEETAETLFWFELIVEADVIDESSCRSLRIECAELLKFSQLPSQQRSEIANSLIR
jgi:four helix bundle protein